MAEVKYLDKTGLTSVWSKVKGIVTPKADKVSGATAGHLAGLNSSGNLMDSGLPASNIAQKDGSYSGMTVGAAEDLVSAESVASEFTSRITGGSTAVGKGGTALVDKIKGRTLVWNQLVQNGNFSNGTTGWSQYNSTISDSNGELTIEKSSGSASTGGFARTSITGDTTHKYYMACEAETLTSGVELYLGFHTTGGTVGGNALASTASSSYQRISQVASPVSSTDTLSIRVGAAASPGGSTGKAKNVILVDLTLMFGAGNEPATAEEFEALYPGPYYAYNPGTLVSNAATAIETVGFNQWDEEWEVGGFNTSTGEKVNSFSNRIRSVNYVPVFGNATYYIKTSNPILLFFYDSNKVFISPYTSVPNTGGTVTTPSNAKYLRFSTSGNPSITTYANDICISLSDPSRNGTYEPHWRSELELGLGDIKVKSHNLWDEVFEANYGYNQTTGIKESNSSACCAGNKIAVNPGSAYKAVIGTANQAFRLFYYRQDGTYKGTATADTSTPFVIPSDVYYITFQVASSIYGTTYNNDICINLSDPAFNGHYEPYGDGGVISIQGGLKSAGTVYDEISGGKLIKRIESVDLGTLTWTYSSSIFLTAGLRGYVKEPASPSDISNIVCTKYPASVYIGGGATVDKVAYVIFQTSSSHGYLYIRDSAYTDAATFKAAVTGVPLYYPLAQPIEYELADALPTAMRNDPYGTERRLPEDTAAIVTAPFRADITYSTNIKEAVQSMHQNFINVNSMQDFLAELGAQMGGTWTMRPADGKFDFTFTPNPVEPTL